MIKHTKDMCPPLKKKNGGKVSELKKSRVQSSIYIEQDSAYGNSLNGEGYERYE